MSDRNELRAEFDTMAADPPPTPDRADVVRQRIARVRGRWLAAGAAGAVCALALGVVVATQLRGSGGETNHSAAVGGDCASVGATLLSTMRSLTTHDGQWSAIAPVYPGSLPHLSAGSASVGRPSYPSYATDSPPSTHPTLLTATAPPLLPPSRADAARTTRPPYPTTADSCAKPRQSVSGASVRCC
ncbi:hypothetical protein F0L68_30315 [Solihabitans fulvus]|uniref:Uncharacterized protein n=1 Tax=Solihabitans fulvus TaxID=1892852 RepID=A0A5B2WTZ4_9PSEU|nr:hypothetical protein [Solihabitans fulvus]KAA2254478.1 hypothetical protein F0L68_30315 [Solihabitans fulvus]